MAEQTQEQKLTPDDAFNVLVAQVHAPVFFQKLASVYGITPQTQEEARELLLIAGQLHNAHEQGIVKDSAARGNFYAEARQNLTQTLTNNGFSPLVDENETQIKRAAADAVKIQLVKEAAVVLSNHLAQTSTK